MVRTAEQAARRAEVGGVELTIMAALPHGERRAARVRASDGDTVATLATALAGATSLAHSATRAGHEGAGEDGMPTLYAGLVPLRPDATLAEVGLLDGTLVGVGMPIAEQAPPAGGWEVAVVGGLHGGVAVPARRDVPIVVGRGSEADLVIADTEVSRSHARITVASGAAGGSSWPRSARDGAGSPPGSLERGSDGVLSDLGSRNGVGWHGFRLDQPVAMQDGDAAQIGESVVALRWAPGPDRVLQAGTAAGTVRYNRPPRITPPPTPHEVVLPDEPEPPRGLRMPLAAVLLPLALGAALFAFMGPTPYLFFIALSPLMMVFNAVGDRRSGRRAYRQAKQAYDDALAALDDDVAALVAAEGRAARREHPDPAGLLAVACGPTGRLWERRPGDHDFLHLRVGLADRPSAVRVRAGRTASEPGVQGTATAAGDAASLAVRKAPPPARLVPVTLDVAEAGVVGLAGRRDTVLGTARAVVAGAATSHSPRDLRLVVVTDHDQAGDWRWATWLPHTLAADDDVLADGAAHTIAVGSQQARARLAGLARLVERQTAASRSPLDGSRSRSGRNASGPRLLVVLDGARRTRPLPGVTELLHDGPAVGVHVLCLDDDEASLPSECRATVVVGDAPTRAVVRRPGAAPLDGVLLDGVAEPLADRLARALAPIRELGGDRAGPNALPSTARLIDLIDEPGAEHVRRRWRSQPGGRSTEALLGVTGDGPFTVDLAADGPHALVAGTTGSGKSELLQTLVASLALGNRPDQLHVVLVDYKGGAAFAACADLPHCVGLVTDLDGHLSERALASLTAELRRREQLLASVGAKDIEGYWASGAPQPLARLVIVVDEFATLVEEVPDFVDGVVGIGMRGRSLGVHVVLATQRPAGVVRGDLRANVNLRICLRVTDESESNDVVDAPDAAWIAASRPGRAYARTGHDQLTCFQTARVGGPRPGSVARASAVEPLTVAPVDVTALGEPPSSAGLHATDEVIDPDDTDLADLVAAVGAAARAEGIAPQRGPWLPPLPALVTTADLDGTHVPPRSDNRHSGGDGHVPLRSDNGVGRLAVTLGLADLPDRQVQEPFAVDLEETGPLLVCGSSRSGRSTVLRTLAAGLAQSTSPADVHLYVVDAGNRALAPLGGLPHCGAWVDADDTDRVGRLVAWLGAEVTRRQRHLSARGFGSLAEQRAAAGSGTPELGAETAARRPDLHQERGTALPYVVVLVDKLEAFNATYADRDGGAVTDALDRLLREGPAVGIVPVLAADRTGVTTRLLSSVQHRLVLRQAERDDYVWFDLPARSLPATLPPGRGFWTDGLVELQVALLDTDPAGTAQAAAVTQLAGELRERWASVPVAHLARRIDPLPSAISPADAEALRQEPRQPSDMVATLAVGGDELQPVDVDLDTSPATFVIAGPPRSGRSTALAAIAATLTRPIVVVAPRPSPLRDLAAIDPAPAARSPQPAPEARPMDRETGARSQGPTVLAVFTGAEQAAAGLGDLLDDVDGPVAVLVDDAELVSDGPLAALLQQVVREGRDHDVVLVAAATTDDLMLLRYRGWLADARRSRHGLLLCPGTSMDGEAFDVKLPRSLSGGWPAGRGLLIERGTTATVQVVQVRC